MKMRKILLLILVLAMMLTMFAACSAKEDPSADITESATTNSGDGETPASVSEEPESMVEVNMWMSDLGQAGSNTKWPLVEEAINEYTEANLNIHINFTWAPISSLPTQFSLAMANNETIDILTTAPIAAGSFLTYYSNGMAMDIAPYLESDGQGIIELMSEKGLMKAFTMPDGGIYGLPTYRILNTNLYISYRKDVLESVGMVEAFNGMKTWADYEEVIKAITENGGTYGIGGSKTLQTEGLVYGTSNFSDAYAYDNLGDSTSMIYTDQSGNVSLTYANEDLLAQFKMFTDWMNKGYVYPDTAITGELTVALIANKTCAGQISGSEFGVEVNKSQSFQTEPLCMQVTTGMLSTSGCNKFAVIVPSTSSEPAAAVRLLNAFYTTPELMNLINWGVECETYVVEEGEAAYPPGADATTSGYHYLDFAFGNQFIALPWQGSTGGDKFRELALEDFLASETSVYMGLTVDVSALDTTRAAIAAVREEFVPQITSGLYTDDLYDEFITKLDAAGIDEYIKLFQDAVSGYIK